MTSNQIRYFIEVADRLNMTAAAERLFLAQSTLSRQISLLEEEFGVSLFTRDKAGLQLTEAGKLFYEEVKAIRERELNLRTRLEQAAVGKPASLHLAVLEEMLPPAPLVRAVRALRCTRPEITISLKPLDSHAIFMELDSGTIDAACTIQNTVDRGSDIQRIRLATEKMLLVANRGIPLPDDACLTPEQISALAGRTEFMMIEPDVFGRKLAPRLRRQLGESFEQGQTERIRYADSDGQIALHVLCGLGVTMVNTSHRLTRAPEIQCREVADAQMIEIVLAFRRQNGNPALPVFNRLVHKELAQTD